MWKHHTCDIQFISVVDDLGIQYIVHEEDKQHLLNALKTCYTISIDSIGSNYCGLTLNGDYQARTLEMSMPNYIPTLLAQLHFESNEIEHSPHQHNVPMK